MTLILNPDHTDDEILEMQRKDAEERALKPLETPVPKTSYLPIPVPKPNYKSDEVAYGKIVINFYAVFLLVTAITWFVYMIMFGTDSTASSGTAEDMQTGLAPGAFVLGILYVSAFFAGLGLLARQAWSLLLAWPVHLVFLLGSPVFFIMGNIGIGIALAGDGTPFGIRSGAFEEGLYIALLSSLAIACALLGSFVLFNNKIRQSVNR